MHGGLRTKEIRVNKLNLLHLKMLVGEEINKIPKQLDGMPLIIPNHGEEVALQLLTQTLDLKIEETEMKEVSVHLDKKTQVENQQLYL